MLKPSVQAHNQNGVLVVEFWDCLRLDPGAVQDVRTKYEAHLRAGGRSEVVVDLLGVGFAGSASLGHFVALHRAARAKGGRLVFCNVDPNVFEVFRVSKLDPLFTFVTDRPAALANVVNGSAATTDGTPKEPPPRKTTESGGNGLLRGSRRRKLS
jgi:anti-anti-sigma factor